MLKVAIASPIKQKEKILKEYLHSLVELKKDNILISYFFIDDEDEGNPMLQKFAAEQQRVTIMDGYASAHYHRTEETHHWQNNIIWKVAAFKDRIIAQVRQENFDYLFLVDSDLVLHPETLTHLIGLKKDIVSEVYWTKWAPDQQALPQVWLGGQYRLFEIDDKKEFNEKEALISQQEFLEKLKIPGTYRVGGLGACTLISQKALIAGVSFAQIDNLDLFGEDRHFCIRANVLGFELFADTHYPPYHIYRESELDALLQYKKMLDKTALQPPHKGKLTLAMLVKNEANRYLAEVLTHAASYADSIVILDDASDDNTIEVCQKLTRGKKVNIVSNQVSYFANEVSLRKQLWSLAIEENNEWILILDADEIFEDEILSELKSLLTETTCDMICFRLYDMWNEKHYREDQYWRAHHFYRPFIVRYQPDLQYEWLETPQHCGRFPRNISTLSSAQSQVRLKHLGWMKAADRLNKFYRYQTLDPQGQYGIKEQYDSILDPKPNLVLW